MSAAIIVVAPTASTAGSFQITQDIVFTVNTSAAAGKKGFVLDNWLVSDNSALGSFVSPDLVYLVNGSSFTSPSTAFYDNFGQSLGNLTANDGYIWSDMTALTAGNTVVFKAGTYSLAAVVAFNPLATQTFTGDVFMINGSNVRISNIVTLPVPEPGAVSLLALGAIALVSRRRTGR
jgi:hypothetical protein